MSRFLSACALLLWLSRALAQEPAPAEPPKAPEPPARSLVYTAFDRNSVEDYRADSGAERRMVDDLVMAVTGQHEVARAWGTLVRPTDRVGIKISAVGGPTFASHHGIVSAIAEGLVRSGVPMSNIIVWDRSGAALRAAGYVSQRGGYQVRSIDPPGGFDPQARFVAPMLGMLIWGDISFRGQKNPVGRATEPDSQVSSESHLARILTRDVTRVINVPTLSDERGCGVAGALYNMTVPNVDNWRRFTQGTGSSSICDLYADPRIASKVALTIMDGLLAQFAGGPEFEPIYSVNHRTVYASRDPVALDSTVLRKLEVWRKEANLPPIGERATWLREAQTIGLGHYDEDKISMVPVTPAS